MTRPPTSGPGRGEAGAVAGLESLAFGFLVFVVGTLVVVNGWSVLDAKLAVEGAAREAARAVVEAAPVEGELPGTASYYRGIARATAASALAGMRPPTSTGGNGAVLDLAATPVVEGSLDRGECVRVTVTVDVPLVAIPIVRTRGGTQRVVGTHSERVEPYRAGLPAPDPPLVGTPC